MDEEKVDVKLTRPEWRYLREHRIGDEFTPKDGDMDTLQNLLEKGLVEEVRQGTWRLTDMAQEVLEEESKE